MVNHEMKFLLLIQEILEMGKPSLNALYVYILTYNNVFAYRNVEIDMGYYYYISRMCFISRT